MKHSKIALFFALTVAATTAMAKLPPLNDEQKAKAEEAKAAAAEKAKVEAELLGKAQDRVAEKYIKEQKAKGVIVKPTPIAPPAPLAAAAPAAPAAAAAPTPTPAPVAAAPAAPAAKK